MHGSPPTAPHLHSRDRVRAIACGHGNGGPVVITGDADGSVDVWDLGTGVLTHRFAGHSGRVDRLRTSSGAAGREVMSVSADSVKVTDIDSGDELRVFNGHSRGTADAGYIAADGRTWAAIAGGDKKIRIWDVTQGIRLRILAAHRYAINSLDCGVINGRPVVVSCDAGAQGRIWDLASGAHIRDIPRLFGVHCTQVDGHWLLARGGDRADEILVQDLATGATVHVLRGRHGTRHITVDDAGRLVSTWTLGLQAWDLRTGSKLTEIKTRQRDVHAIACGQRAGRTVVITVGNSRAYDGEGSRVRAWHLDNGEPGWL